MAVKTIVHIDMDQKGIGTSQKRFVAESLDAQRKVNPRRIFHYDTSIDQAAQSAFNGNATLKAYVAKGKDYQRDDSTKEEGQYVEHEVVKRLEKHINAEAWSSGGDNQQVQLRLRNQYLINESVDATLDKLGPNNRNPPYRIDPFQNIVNVRFRTLYLVVTIDGGNSSFSGGPYGAAPSVGAASLSSEELAKGVKLLDTNFDMPGGNTTTNGFINCFVYFAPLGAQTAWELWKTTGSGPASTFGAVNNSCPWPGPGDVPENVAIEPVDFEASATAAKAYLYKIPAGDDLVKVSVIGISAPSDNHDPINQVSTSGSGHIKASVYSTVKDQITELSQLIDYANDGKPRPTEDDACVLSIINSNEGNYSVIVKLDKDPANAQIDNYGKSFQPYKATFDHGDFVDQIPSQPPTPL